MKVKTKYNKRKCIQVNLKDKKIKMIIQNTRLNKSLRCHLKNLRNMLTIKIYHVKE